MKDTAEQSLAQSFDRHLSVTANAGSGKTRVLENRYINLLMNADINNDPRKITAITFTRKAASEILIRIADNLDDKYRNAESIKESQKILRIREKLQSAPISTIHSFCASLLRDFPIEADISPNFTEINDADNIRITGEAINNLFEEYLEGDEGQRELLKNVFGLYGRSKVETYIRNLLNHSELMPVIIDFYNRYSNDDIIQIRDKAAIAKVRSSLEASLEHISFVISNIDEELFHDLNRNKKKEIEGYAEVKRLYREQLDSSERIDRDSVAIEDLIDLCANIIEIKKLLYKKNDNELFKHWSDCCNDPDSHVIAKAADEIQEIIKICDLVNTNLLDYEMLKYVRIILALYVETDEKVEEEKQLLGALSFDDMLLKTREMLNDDDVRQAVRRKIKYLMVDEFQDTNQLQYDIITSIVPELIGKTDILFDAKEGVNLFVVGDAKQSIYGFRNADVRVFNKASRDIYNFNQNRFVAGEISEKFLTPSGEMNAGKDEEIRGNLELSSSFRLAALNAAFVNKVCGNIMSAGDSDYDVVYTPFVCGHKSIELFAGRNTLVEPVDLSEFGSEIGTAEILLYIDESAQTENSGTENPAKSHEEPSIKNEGELLALRIKELVESDNNNYTYGNVAVLSRSRTKFPDLAEAFREFNLPYILHSGNGFFETQEISDIISILNFLHNPYDDISLTGTLKSPFFSLSDTMLLKIKINHSENWKYSADPLWDKLVGFCTNDDSNSEEFDDSAAAKRAVRILSDLLSHAASMTIGSLIGEILNRTTWRAAVKNMRGKEQAEANIEKLISYARDFENRGFRNMFDFTEELKLIIDSNVNEGEAVFSASTDAINVMTIHASKGLEFPVVALYNSNARSGRPENFFVNEKFGISFPTVVTDQQSGVRKTASTLLQELNRDMKKVSESAEEKRILYVALTRAESHIIVSGSSKLSKSGALSAPLGFMKMIVAGLGTDLNEMTAEDTSMQSDNLFILKDNELFEHKLTFPIKITTNVSSEVSETADKTKNGEIPERLILINDLTSGISKEIYSATKLSTFEKDPVSYIDTYILGLPQEYESEAAKPKAGSDNDSMQGSMAGTLIHEVLENIKYWFDESGNVDEEKLKEYADHAVNESERYIPPKLKKRILTECSTVASTDLLKSVAKNISESSSESISLIPIGQDYITAATDLIVETASGKEIWDWKTNYIDSSEKMDELAKVYELQMKIYAYFYYLNSPDQADYTARLLFTAEAAAKAKTKNWTHVFTWSNAEVESFGDMIAGKIEELRAGTFTV